MAKSKGYRVSGIFVPIQLDTSAVDRDLESLRESLGSTVKEISKAFDGAINPKNILRGVVDINKALGQIRDSSQVFVELQRGFGTFERSLQNLSPELKKLSDAFGGNIQQQQELYRLFSKNQAVQQQVTALRTLEKYLGITKDAVVELVKSMGGSISNEALKKFLPVKELKDFTGELGKLSAEYRKLSSAAGQAMSQEAWEKFRDNAAIKAAYDATKKLNEGQKLTAKNFAEIAKQANVSVDAVKRYIAAAEQASNINRGWTGIFTPSNVAAGAQSALSAFGVVGGMYGLAELTKAAYQASLKMDNLNMAFQSIYGTSAAAGVKLEYVAAISDKLGLSFLDTAEGAKKLFAAAKGTEVEKNAEEIFTAFSTMGAALKLTGSEMESVFLAVSQMISKGKVSAEELRLQLAERMPGAVNLFAKAIGKTTAELDDMLQKGEVGLDSLVKFAAEVQKTYAAGADAASKGLQAQLNRVSNAWFELKKAFVDAEGSAEAVGYVANALKSLTDLVPAITELGAKLLVFGSIAATLKVFATVGSYVLSFEAAIATATKSVGGFVAVLNLLKAHPIFLVASALTAAYTAYDMLTDDLPEGTDRVSKYAASFSELTEKANNAAGAVQNTAAAVTERIKKSYEEAQAALAQGIGGGFEALFYGSTQNDLLKLVNWGPQQDAFAAKGAEIAKEFSKRYQQALEEESDAGKSAALAWYQKAMGELNEQVQKSNLPDSVKQKFDEAAGAVVNAVNKVEGLGAQLKEGQLVAAFELIGLKVRQFAADYKSLMSAAESTAWGKAFKEDKALDDSIKAFARMSENISEVRENLNQLSAQRESGAITEAQYAEAVKLSAEKQEEWNTAATALNAIAIQNGMTIDDLKNHIQQMGEKFGWAAPLVEFLTEALDRNAAAARNAASSKTLEAYEQYLTKLDAMGRKANAIEAQNQKRSELMEPLIKQFNEGSISAEQFNQGAAKVEAAVLRLADNADKSGRSVESAAKKQASYAETIVALRAEVEALNRAYNDESVSVAKARLNAEKEIAIAKALAKANKDLINSKATPSQVDEYRSLTIRKVELDYAMKLRDLENKNFQERLNFYEELSKYSGEYEASEEYQLQLLEKKAKAWKNLEISQEDILKMMKYKQLELSKDPFDGAYRGLQKFTAAYADEAKQWETIASNFATGFDSVVKDMFSEFLLTGRTTFDQLNSFFQKMLIDMAYQAMLRPIVVSVVGGAQEALYGSTTVGQGGLSGLTGIAGSAAQQYGMSQLTSGAGGFINAGAAYLAPSLFAPSASQAAINEGLNAALAASSGAYTGYGGATAPTMTFTQAFGAPAIGAGIGSIASPLVNNILGIQNNQGSQIGSTIGGLGSTAILGIAAANGWNPGGWVLGGLAALGSIFGGGIGGLFGGGGDKDPWVNISSWVDLLGEIDQYDPYQARSYRTSGTGYEITANQGEGISWETGKQLADMAAGLSQEAIKSVATFRESVAAIGNDAMEASFGQALEKNRFLKHWYEWEDREVKPEELMEDFQRAVQEKLYLSLTEVDLSTLTTAADGAIADTIPEIAKAITDSVNFVALGANLGEYQDDFNAAISGKLLDALNQIDTSGIALDVDKSSLAGWEAAAKALQAWDEIDAALQEIINPTSELTTTLNAATAQFDSWIERLRDLGWQEEAIAGIEAKRAQYMFEYANALKRATEQDLNLRVLALRYGNDSSEYGLQSLQYKQQNELAELEKKFGRDSDIYNQAVKVQQAELLKYQLDMLLSQKDQLLSEEITSQRDLASSLDDLVKALKEARTNIWTGEDNLTGSRFEDSLANFNWLYTSAMGGDQEALRELPTAATELLDLGRDNLSSWQEYNDLFYDVDQKLKAAQDNAEEQYDASQAQLNALGKMVEQGDNVQMSLDEILAQIEELQNALSGKLDELTGGGSLNQREALIQAKVDQLNAIAQGGRTDWTAESFLSYLYREGLTLQSWYDKFGKYENLGVDYDSGAAYMAILENTAALMNAGLTLAPGQEAGGWTAEKVLEQIKKEGMTVDEWYLRYGMQEGVGDYDREAAYMSILENKAALMNAGLTLAPGQEAGGWTAEKVLEQIKKEGMTVDEWYLRYGMQEGVGDYYKKYSQDAADSTNETLWDTNKVLSGDLSSINDSINGLDWNVVVNVSGGGSYGGGGSSGGGSYGGGGSSGGGNASGGVSSWESILQNKADALNRGETLSPGQVAGGWTADKVADAIKAEGMTVEEWYDRFGKLEGFASGGITPVNRPFWVGENGPELVVSPRQYGVLSNEQSMNLIRNEDEDGDGHTVASVIREGQRQMYDVLRQILTKLDSIYGQNRRIVRNLDSWNAEGVPLEA